MPAYVTVLSVPFRIARHVVGRLVPVISDHSEILYPRRGPLDFLLD